MLFLDEIVPYGMFSKSLREYKSGKTQQQQKHRKKFYSALEDKNSTTKNSHLDKTTGSKNTCGKPNSEKNPIQENHIGMQRKLE